MRPTVKSLGIDRVDVEERLDLVEEIWASIAADPLVPSLTSAQRADLDLRIADHKVNPDDVVPWSEVKAEAEARFRR
jgi:putative addiction module component (TIGR02574 family)